MPESLNGADSFLLHPSLAGIDRSVESPPSPSSSEAGQTDRADLFGRERGSLSFPRSSPRAAHCAPRPSFLMRHAATLPRSSREKQVVAVFLSFLTSKLAAEASPRTAANSTALPAILPPLAAMVTISSSETAKALLHNYFVFSSLRVDGVRGRGFARGDVPTPTEEEGTLLRPSRKRATAAPVTAEKREEGSPPPFLPLSDPPSEPPFPSPPLSLPMHNIPLIGVGGGKREPLSFSPSSFPYKGSPLLVVSPSPPEKSVFLTAAAPPCFYPWL